MALPVRVSREQAQEPSSLMRRDWPDLLERLFWGPSFGGGRWGEISRAAPFGVDVREDHLYVEADLPGFRKEDVDVTLDNGVLTITAEKREEPAPAAEQKRQRQQQGNYLLRERRYERFERSFTLPQSVDEQSANAKLENGCLTITLDKTEKSKAKRIPLA